MSSDPLVLLQVFLVYAHQNKKPAISDVKRAKHLLRELGNGDFVDWLEST